MRSNINTLNSVKDWLKENNQTQTWLAEQMEVAPSLVSQIFNETRNLQPVHIEKMASITGKSIKDLANFGDKKNNLVYSLRGEVTNKNGEDALRQLLLDAEHFMQLINK